MQCISLPGDECQSTAFSSKLYTSVLVSSGRTMLATAYAYWMMNLMSYLFQSQSVRAYFFLTTSVKACGFWTMPATAYAF